MGKHPSSWKSPHNWSESLAIKMATIWYPELKQASSGSVKLVQIEKPTTLTSTCPK